jgi:hypothetical protein
MVEMEVQRSQRRLGVAEYPIEPEVASRASSQPNDDREEDIVQPPRSELEGVGEKHAAKCAADAEEKIRSETNDFPCRATQTTASGQEESKDRPWEDTTKNGSAEDQARGKVQPHNASCKSKALVAERSRSASGAESGSNHMNGRWPMEHAKPTISSSKVAVLLGRQVNDSLSVPVTCLLHDALSVRSYRS